MILKTRNKTEIIKSDFAHIINKKNVSEELKCIQNFYCDICTSFLNLWLPTICTSKNVHKFHIIVLFPIRSVTGNKEFAC
jgi:hypothetical protein